MNNFSLIYDILKKSTRGMTLPASLTIVERYGRNPFIVLISCLLSLRTKDTISLPASIRLFEQAQTPDDLLKLSNNTIEQLIFPVGFYKRKTVQIKKICHFLIENFKGTVPKTQEELMRLPGVGLKTANLVLSIGFQIPALCVDIHVHRISNRLGLINTTTPEETERELQKIISKNAWIDWNTLLVMWGQNICFARAPRCLTCPLAPLCPKIGVTSKKKESFIIF